MSGLYLNLEKEGWYSLLTHRYLLQPKETYRTATSLRLVKAFQVLNRLLPDPEYSYRRNPYAWFSFQRLETSSLAGLFTSGSIVHIVDGMRQRPSRYPTILMRLNSKVTMFPLSCLPVWCRCSRT